MQLKIKLYIQGLWLDVGTKWNVAHDSKDH